MKFLLNKKILIVGALVLVVVVSFACRMRVYPTIDFSFLRLIHPHMSQKINLHVDDVVYPFVDGPFPFFKKLKNPEVVLFSACEPSFKGDNASDAFEGNKSWIYFLDKKRAYSFKGVNFSRIFERNESSLKNIYYNGELLVLRGTDENGSYVDFTFNLKSSTVTSETSDLDLTP